MGHQTKLMMVAAWTAVEIAMLLGTGATGSAAAQRQGPCADDAAKFCKDIQPGGGRIARCLKQHGQELSPACKHHVAEVKRRGQEFRAACEDDVIKLCGDVKPGRGRIVNCLKQHDPELTPDCRSQMQQKQSKGK
jgi:hypothetical protein